LNYTLIGLFQIAFCQQVMKTKTYTMKLLRNTHDGIPCNSQQREHFKEIQRCTNLGLVIPVVALCPVGAITVDYDLSYFLYTFLHNIVGIPLSCI
jgi:hypothetical protein